MVWMQKPWRGCYHKLMQKRQFFQTLMAAALTLLGTQLFLVGPASAQLLGGVSGELSFLRGKDYPENPDDSKTALISGAYFGTSALELRPGVILSEGQSQGFLVDVGLRVTPKWFGQNEYLFNLISPYGVLGGSVSYPWSFGWSAKAGIGIAVLRYASINAELGYRSHRLSESALLEGVTVGLHASYPF